MIQERFKKELVATLRLALPIIIAQLGVVLMGVTDNIMVGQYLGKIALGAAGVANSIAFLIASLAVGGLSVIAPMVSKCRAENDQIGMQKLYATSFWVVLIYSFVLSGLGLGAYAYFEIFQQPAKINRTSPAFLLVILASNVPLYLFSTLKQFSDGLSKPKVAMYITVFGLLLNLFCNYTLINGYFSFPKLGLIGSAYATLFTRIIMVIVLFFYLKKHKTYSSYFAGISSNLDLVSQVFKRSVPAGSQFFFEIAAFSFAVIMMGWISETALAAHQIAINIASTTYMMATGFAFAGGIRVGKAWGEQSPKGIRMAGFAAYFWVFVFMLFSMLLILIFDDTLLRFYITDEEVIQHALPLLTIAAIFQLSDGVQVVGLGVLRGLADISLPTYITFVAYWIIALPLGYWLCFNYQQGSTGIWIGLLIGLTVSAALLYFRFLRLISLGQLKKRFKQFAAN
jgi:multidrug resistance protein, MATE family